MPDARKLWAAVGHLNAEAQQLTASADVASFVLGTFRAFEGDGGLIDLCGLVSLHSRRDERRWISLRDMLSERDRDLLLAAAVHHPKGEPTTIEELGVWLIVHAMGPSVLIALFEDRASAMAGSADIAMLAAVLRLGLATSRRIEDGKLMAQLAFAPWQMSWPRGALHGAMASIARHMRSDGAKIYLCRRTEMGACIEIFSRTDLDQPGGTYRVSTAHGLADWVLVHDDHIIIDDSVPPDRVKAQPERCHTGRHGTVSVMGRPGRDQDPRDPTGDRERAFLLVPLRAQDRVIGVLSFWRLSEDTYDVDLDLVSAEHLAARLAPICQSILATEVRDAVARELAALGALVAMARNPQDIYAKVAASAGALARGARALLFLADERGVLYATAEWPAVPPATPQSRAVYFSIDSDPRSWPDSIPALVKTRIEERYPSYKLRPRALLLAASRTSERMGVVFVLDRDEPERLATCDCEAAKPEPLATCDDELAEYEAGLFLKQVAPTVFESYSKVFAASVGRRVRDVLAAAPRSPTRWSDIAQTIRQEMLVDAVLLYQRDGGTFKVVGASEGHRDLINMLVARSSLTEWCIDARCHKLIPDATDWTNPDVQSLHRKTLTTMLGAFGWKGIRSWYCQPVFSGDQGLGAVKLLTRDAGMFLDRGCVEVVTAIAARIANEMSQHLWTEVLQNLNRLAENLTGKEGAALASSMLHELEQWTHRFVDPDCHVVVMAPVQGPQPTVFTASEPIDAKAFEQANAQQLATLSNHAAQAMLAAVHPFALPGGLNRTYQLAVPISLASNPTLKGCLLLITKQPVGQQARSTAREAAREAAREIAILLDYEQRARLRIEQTARFRHALLGPIQGLMNQAGELNRLLKRGEVPPEDLKRIAAYIKSEANAIGLWREIQRLYETNQVKVVPRTRALRPIVERCVDRFREPIQAERTSTLQLDFRPAGSLEIPIDEPAIDLVLNNLLDNARKYCFSNTNVIVTVENSRTLVRVSVEDTGHGIPERLTERIYQVGERLDWEDHVRSITGTGLGLPISRAVVEAHGGRLYHECDPPMTTSETKRSRVRFIMELPSGWR